MLLHFYRSVTLGHTLLYNKKPDRIFSFSRGGTDTFFLPAVHIWGKGSVVEYWVGSQNHCLPVLSNGDDQPQEPLFEYMESTMIEAGCERREFRFDNGAMYGFLCRSLPTILMENRILVDARIAFTRTNKPVIFGVFFPDDLIAAPPMILNYWSPEIQEKVDDLQSANIKANFRRKTQD